MNYPGRIIAGFIMIVLISIFPLQYLAQTNSDTIDALVEEKTQAFSDSIRKKGRLDISMYEDFIHFLDTTGELYDVEIEDIHPVTGEDLSHAGQDGNAVACTDSSHNHSTDKTFFLTGRKSESPAAVSMKYTEPRNDKAILYQTNKDGREQQIKSFAAHTHNDDCYHGTLHICDGINCDYGLTAVASAQGGLYYSINGLNWTKAITCNPVDVTYGNGRFVAVGSNATWTSIDGITWTENPISLQFYKVLYGAGVFMALTSDNYGHKAYMSKDGVNWTYITGVTSQFNGIGYSEGYFYVGHNNGYYTIWVYNSGNSYYVSSGGSSGVSTSFGNAADYVLGHYSDSSYLYFYRGNTQVAAWSNKISETYYYYSCYMKGNGNYIFFARSSESYAGTYRSTGLPSFGTKISSFTMGAPERGIYFGNKYLMAGYQTNYSSALTAVSADGVSWITASAPERLHGLACNIEGGTGVMTTGPCKKVGKYYNISGVEVQPICDQVVTSITATHPEQAVREGENIITTATATYLDGHTGIVSCTSNFDPNRSVNQTVTLTYSGLVGNGRTVGTRTCELSVTLIGNSPLTYISVDPSMQTIERYMLPSFIVTAFYEDGSSKTVYADSIAGFDAVCIGTQNVIISYSEGGITKTVDVIVTVTPLNNICAKCGSVYPLDQNDIDKGCPICTHEIARIEVEPNFVVMEQGVPLNITVKAIYKDGHNEVANGWISNYDPNNLGMKIVTVEYGGYAAELTVWVEERTVNCPICGSRYPVSDDKCPICSENVVRIIVSPGTITVNQNDRISLTVIAQYADGSSGLVNDWSIDRTSAEPGTYTATVSYQSVNTTLTLIVIPLTVVQCPICELIYEPPDYPKGCPICSETITGIEAYLSSGSNLAQFGTTPSITIILVFRDEHRELDTEGYTIDNYNSYQLGTQTIMVNYGEFFVDLEVMVVDTLSSITCPNDHVYYLNEDGTDQGCPYCNMAGKMGTVYFFEIVYSNEIIDIVYAEGKYVFIQGNYITVTVTKKNVSLFYHMQNTFFRTSMLGMKKKLIHGGGVY